MEECYLNFVSMTYYRQDESNEIKKKEKNMIFFYIFIIQKYKE